MPSLAKQIRRKAQFLLRGDLLVGLVDRLIDLGGPIQNASLDSCIDYLEYLENVDIDGEEPVEGPPASGQRQTMLFDEQS